MVEHVHLYHSSEPSENTFEHGFLSASTAVQYRHDELTDTYIIYIYIYMNELYDVKSPIKKKTN